MFVRAGEPILNSDVKIVRVARLGSESDMTKSIAGNDFELKKQVCDLFEELERLKDGTVLKLEFRHGLPFLVETTPSAVPASEPAPIVYKI